jgi:hypothetical protein
MTYHMDRPIGMGFKVSLGLKRKGGANNMKSVEVQFNEVMEALKKAGKLETFNEKSAGLTGVETKLNCAEAILKESKITRKHNGAADNGGNDFTEGYTKEDESKALVESYRTMGLNKKAARLAAGLPSLSRKKTGLNEVEYRQFSAYCASGMSEAEALIMASPTHERQMKAAIRRGKRVPEFLESLG